MLNWVSQIPECDSCGGFINTYKWHIYDKESNQNFCHLCVDEINEDQELFKYDELY